MGLWQRTAVNVGWTALLQALSVGLYQLILLILASILTPFDFGVYAACTVVNAVLVQLTTFGLDYAVIYSKIEWKRVVSTGTLLRVVLSLIGFGLVIAFSRPISELFQIENLELPLILGSSAAVIIAFAFPPQVDLAKNLLFKRLSMSRFYGSLTWSILALTLALLDWSYWSLVVALAASQLATVGSAYMLSSQRFSIDFDKETANRLVRFGGVTASGLFLAFLAGNLDKFVVGSVVGPNSLGIYWAMFIYGTVSPQFLTGIINAVTFPTYTVLRGRPESLRKAYAETLRYVSEFSALISMGLAAGSSLFVMVLLGERWESGIESLSFLSIAGFFLSMTSPAGNVFISLGRPELIFSITLAFLVPMIPLLVLAAYAYGIVGVSAVIMGHEGAKCVYVVYKAGRLTGVKPESTVREILPSVSAGICAGIVIFLTSVFFEDTVVGLILAIALGLPTYLFAGQVFSRGALLRDIREGVRAIRNK